MLRRHHYILLVFFALLWTTGFLAAPMLPSSFWLKSMMYDAYGRVCHQLADRSFEWFGGPWAVCHRCSAIYLAFTAVLLVVPMVKPLNSWKPAGKLIILFSLAPMAFDVMLNFFGIHSATMESRILTGAIAGAGLCLVVVPLFFEGVHTLISTREFSRRTVC